MNNNTDINFLTNEQIIRILVERESFVGMVVVSNFDAENSSQCDHDDFTAYTTISEMDTLLLLKKISEKMDA